MAGLMFRNHLIRERHIYRIMIIPLNDDIEY